MITVSFLPVFTLEAQEGRMFKPLALTKSFAMAGGALLSVTLVPALMILFIRGRILPEQKNPLNRALIWIYRPIIAGPSFVHRKTVTIGLALLGTCGYGDPADAPWLRVHAKPERRHAAVICPSACLASR